MMVRQDIDGQIIRDARPKLEERLKAISIRQRPSLREPVADDAPWFVAEVQQGHECTVEKDLIAAGVQTALPMRKGPARKRRGRIIPASDMPLMGGYLLVRFAVSNEALNAFYGFDHVSGLLGGWDKPFTIMHWKVTEILRRSQIGDYDWQRQAASRFQPGETVRIGDGVFAGLSGEIVNARSDGRGDAVVEVELMGRKTPMLIPLAILEKL
ncbi:transcription termination/antitermination NusG family protein [Martelella sp. HB161492]|uniref:transcription termination/antitermination protein NusG n=1 Tax=Martelella sp. HB161492 TaxID=2720726 RepID=UPI001591C8E3|nr:transcription termination/antitermination NusG family protein [Martelella sp. HB161492]